MTRNVSDSSDVFADANRNQVASVGGNDPERTPLLASRETATTATTRPPRVENWISVQPTPRPLISPDQVPKST